MRNTFTIHRQRVFSTLLAAIAVAILLAGTYVTTTGKPRHKPPAKLTSQAKIAALEPTDTNALIQRFGALQSPTFVKWLQSTMPPPMSAKARDEAFPRAAWQVQLNIVTDPKTCDRLQQQAAPALKLFARQDTAPFVIYYDNFPQMQTVAGYIAISTGLARLIKTDAQLNGLVSHELARDLFKQKFAAAWKDGEFQTIRQFELFYDAVAVSALQYLGLPSEDYARILGRMVAHTPSEEDFSMSSQETKRHPPIAERLTLIREINLRQSPITSITIATR